MFTDKMECRLIEIAGGQLANHRIERERRPGITLSKEQFCSLRPDIIIVTGFAAWPKSDFSAYCLENELYVPALRTGRIHHLHPYRSSTNPDWILGLMCLANIIHPKIFAFDLEQESNSFNQKFRTLPSGTVYR
jgi:ABC-type Fe3+-hydroxamate transport system substrate-binding protein